MSVGKDCEQNIDLDAVSVHKSGIVGRRGNSLDNYLLYSHSARYTVRILKLETFNRY